MKLTFPNGGSTLTALTSSEVETRHNRSYSIHCRLSSSAGAQGNLQLQITNYPQGTTYWTEPEDTLRGPLTDGSNLFINQSDAPCRAIRIIYTPTVQASGTIEGEVEFS